MTDRVDNKALPIMVNLGLAGAGNTVGLMEASSAAEYAQSAVGLINAIASTINDVSEAVG